MSALPDMQAQCLNQERVRKYTNACVTDIIHITSYTQLMILNTTMYYYSDSLGYKYKLLIQYSGTILFFV